MSDLAHHAADIVRARAPEARPRVGIVLGSGLGGLADRVDNPTTVDFSELPGFPMPSVEGHAGRLVLGTLADVPVVCLQGRVHLYEGHPPSTVVPMIRTLHLLGAQTLLATNAAGAIDPDAQPGQLMLLTDHINFQFGNALVGENDERFGPRFPAMDAAYDPALRSMILEVAQSEGIALRQGVYLATLGPTFETPAEVRAFGIMGANAVGMSTVPEVIVARHCGMRVAAISVLTNLAAGLSEEALSHDQTLHYSAQAADALQRLVLAFLPKI